MSTAPSLFGSAAPQQGAPSTARGQRQARDLMDLLFEGFYMVFLLRNRHLPGSAVEFRERVKSFLASFERGSQRLNASAEDVFLAKFAFTALVDELALSPTLNLRESWERRPLQLELFGEQLAGEKFFEHLETLRTQGAAKLQVLEVFHMCLLLGFQGRYVLEGSEKLGYLTARLGDEIAHLRGKRAPFAPHALAPDRILHTLRHEVPVWAFAAVFALFGLLAYLGLQHWLSRETEARLMQHSQLVQLAPQAAHVTITLP
ncbi:type IVB secretion system protein IcmH/DotU [Inhella proteolytica]|uniref:DotU family type IV/VI secretion system protein n=1 Tax=Inhella proteolytica TaxID=2795029 RepID=A0A931J7C1_9BURK|nr:type IVB secretion system protein IcmH/DotU [Inhella proteolytica]MBH9578879.1 DotU family type IV/VI secretion system protein [Inhella proteolytica]